MSIICIRAYSRMIEERRSRGLPCDWQNGEDVLHWSLGRRAAGTNGS